MDGKSHSKTLKPEIQKIRLSELESFIGSKTFRKAPVVPISPSRARSYLENPHGKPDDVALYLAVWKGNLVAFRSLFAGVAQTKAKTFRFGWSSGAWVHPEFRRKGLSKQLLKMALEDWGGRLMITNYAPEAEKLILSTNLFRPIHQFEGARAYLFPKTVKLIRFARQNGTAKIMLSLTDLLISGFSTFQSLFFSPKKHPEIWFEELGFPDKECFQFIEKGKENFLFPRGEDEWKWIFRFPWISDNNRAVKEKYPFSTCSASFFYRTVKVRVKNKLNGIFIFSVREGHLKTLSFWLPPGLENETARFLKQYCVKHKLEMITVNNSGIARQLFARKFPFLHVKKTGKKIYSSFDVSGAEGFLFQDGDGDTVFT